jgi:hypothetical protein
MYSILHISDLHRSHEEPVDNDSLLAALLADGDRYAGENPRVPPPDAIVVSGDIIQGARIGSDRWQQSMTDQYVTAEQFLDALCQSFLGGDRTRLILIPGNHDVCWNSSLAAMQKIDENSYPKDVFWALHQPDSNYRWSWAERALYRIVDHDQYNRRMGYYWDFAERFYRGVKLPIDLDRTRGFQLFEVCEGRIVIAAFDTISGNDCFGFAGAIPRGAIGRCAMALRDMKRSHDLRMAVWHHSIQGPPVRSDYMDTAQVQEMAGHGFQLGLHGHQHIAATQTQLIHLDESRSMAVVSAGSLCAGARELPRGTNRQYNMIVIDDNFLQARVHVRESAEGDHFTRKQNGAFSGGFVTVSWQPPVDTMGRIKTAHADNQRRAIAEAESELRKGGAEKAVRLLKSTEVDQPSYARKLLITALSEVRDWPGLIGLLSKPFNPEEIVTLIHALIENKQFEDALAHINAAGAVDRATLSALNDKLNIKQALEQK